MVLYYCSRCSYTHINRTIFTNHLNRKNTCKATVSSVTIFEIKEQYGMLENQTPNNTQTALDSTQ